ncbi:MAG: LpxI family protein [Roseovarius sp.]
MSGRLAILACGGQLPVMLAAAYPEAACVSLKGIPHLLGDRAEAHQIEKLGGLFKALKAQGVDRIVFAGHLARPALNPAKMDAKTLTLVPRIMKAMQGGDDGVLRLVISIFEDQGFAVLGAHTLLPDLTVADSLRVGTPTKADMHDSARGFAILAALAPLDVGQGCVVAGGQVLGIETVQGTNALLHFVADTRAGKTGGVFAKASKQGQDLRVDMPAIGPDTVTAVARAGLAGIVVEAGRVMILEREKTLQAIEKAGLFLTARGA